VARSPRDWFAPQAKLPCAVARFWPASSWPLQAAWAKPDLWSAFASTASYVMRAAEKMRRYKVAADNLFVFMHTNTFNNDPFYSNGASAQFSATTNDTGEVVALAVRLGGRLWREGFRYSKTGVMITELRPEAVRQPALWNELDRERHERVWKTMDKLNATLGRDTVRILSAGPRASAWKLRAEH
jgi:DNA polymerase V